MPCRTFCFAENRRQWNWMQIEQKRQLSRSETATWVYWKQNTKKQTLCAPQDARKAPAEQSLRSWLAWQERCPCQQRGCAQHHTVRCGWADFSPCPSVPTTRWAAQLQHLQGTRREVTQTDASCLQRPMDMPAKSQLRELKTLQRKETSKSRHPLQAVEQEAGYWPKGHSSAVCVGSCGVPGIRDTLQLATCFIHCRAIPILTSQLPLSASQNCLHAKTPLATSREPKANLLSLLPLTPSQLHSAEIQL